MIGAPPGLLAKALYGLYSRGMLEKSYTDDFDPARPFDTATWSLKEKRAWAERSAGVEYSRLEEQKISIVLSFPISVEHAERLRMLNRFKALDFNEVYETVVESAEKELKIACPVIDTYGISPILNKLRSSESLKVRIITEMSKSRELEYYVGVVGSERFKVLDASRTSSAGSIRRKVSGVHVKMIVADDEIALVGSFNFARYHYLVNFDLGFLINDRKTVRTLSDYFEYLWSYASS